MPEVNNLLEAVRSFVSECPFLADIDILHIDQVDEQPQSYAVTTAGLAKLSEDILGGQTWQYNALLQSREYTADDLSRLNASAFTENFVFWVEDRNSSRQFPQLPDGFEPVSISADNGMLLALDEDGDRGIYQVQIHLVFKR